MKWRIVCTLLWFLSVHSLFYLCEQLYHSRCVGTGYTGFFNSILAHFDSQCMLLRAVSHHTHSRLISYVTSVVPFLFVPFLNNQPAVISAVTDSQVDASVSTKRRRVVHAQDTTEFGRHLRRRIGANMEDKIELLE